MFGRVHVCTFYCLADLLAVAVGAIDDIIIWRVRLRIFLLRCVSVYNGLPCLSGYFVVKAWALGQMKMLFEVPHAGPSLLAVWACCYSWFGCEVRSCWMASYCLVPHVACLAVFAYPDCVYTNGDFPNAPESMFHVLGVSGISDFRNPRYAFRHGAFRILSW